MPPSETLRHYRGSPFGSANRRICGLLTLAQISQGETSHISRTLRQTMTCRTDLSKKLKEIVKGAISGAGGALIGVAIFGLVWRSLGKELRSLMI